MLTAAQWDTLPIGFLRELLKRFHQPTTGNKPELLQRWINFLSTQTNSPTMANPSNPSPWSVFTIDRLKQVITDVGLLNTTNNTHQELCDLLDNIPSLTPAFLFQPQAHTSSSFKETKLQAQSKTETLDQFLDRAQAFFDIMQVTPANQLAHLINAAQPEVAQFAAELYRAGTTTTAEIVKALQQRFGLSRFQFFEQFQQTKIRPTDTIEQVGAELKRLYLKYLQFTEADFLLHEKAITPALLAQLLKILPTTTATQLRQEMLRDASTKWADILKFADNLLSAQPLVNRPSRPRTCSIHGQCSHDDRHCWQQKRSSSSRDPTTVKDDSVDTPRCFKCNKKGHLANDCRSRSLDQSATTGKF